MRLAVSCALLMTVGCGDNAIAPDAMPLVLTDAAPAACTVTPGEPDLALETVTVGIDSPINVATAPGDDRAYIVAQHDAAIYILDPASGAPLMPAFLDIEGDVATGYEEGLLAIVFHPRYPADGRFFISYSKEGGEGDPLVVEEWHVDPANLSRGDESTRKVILEVPHSRGFHFGAQLAFGLDGFLYVSTGDGGPQRDADNNAQNLDSLRGKLLRLDIDHKDPGLEYAIPPGNPFIGAGRGEIYAWGLRNPWAMDIAPSGHIFIGDVGFDSSEEVDVIPGDAPPGLNFGWPILEGATECLAGAPCDTTGLTPPIYEYAHEPECAISGVVQYRGCSMPGHHGKVFLSDFCGSWVRSFVYSEGQPIAFEHEYPDLNVGEQLSKLAQGPDGELYVLGYMTGTIYKVVPKLP